MGDPIRIVVADDHELFREGLKLLLRGEPDTVVVAETDRVEGLSGLVASVPCDVLLLDLQMERSAVAEIEALAALVKVVVVTANELSDEPLIAIRSGARAVVFKRFAVETLMAAIRAAAAGNVWMPPTLQTRLAEMVCEVERKRLTPRELDVVRHVAMGLKNADIARRLFITEDTVKAHLTNVFAKLGVRDRWEVALHALRTGMVGLHERPDRARG
jgi:DNA-binding NarL/FixJ family response regulator